MIWHTNTLAWRTKRVGSDHKYWPPLERAVADRVSYTALPANSLSIKQT